MKKKNQPDLIQEAPFRSSRLAETRERDVIGRRHARSLRRPRGRLDPSVLVMLGRGLKDCFDDARNHEVPERIKMLLQRF